MVFTKIDHISKNFHSNWDCKRTDPIADLAISDDHILHPSFKFIPIYIRVHVLS